MQRIPTAAPVNPPKEDKLAYRVVRSNRRTYGWGNEPVELQEWIRCMEKMFTVIEVPKEKRVDIATFYLIGEANSWWGTMKDDFVGPECTWAKFLDELRAKFYTATIQCQKERSSPN